MTSIELLFLACLTGLEFFFPKNKYKKKIFRRGFLEDCFYLFMAAYFTSWVVSTFVGDFETFFEEYIIYDFTGYPILLQGVIYFLLTDFMRFFIHLQMHRIPLLWRAHKLHHSSEELTTFSAVRTSFLEEAVMISLVAIPLSALKFDIAVVGAVITFFSLHGFYLHSNWNLRFPRILKFTCSNHFHHWHHAVEELVPGGQNFGVTLTIWDRIIGTHHDPKRAPELMGLYRNKRFAGNFFSRYLNPLAEEKLRD